MKKLKLIYNPFSGDKSFKFELDVCISIFQEAGYEAVSYTHLNYIVHYDYRINS